MTSLATHRRRTRILFTLGVLVATASYNPAHGQDLGQLSVNPYAPNSTANPDSPAGSPYSATSVSREARSAQAAIVSAMMTIKKAIPTARLVELCPSAR